ncbi:MAG: MBL fold metallo-hydrolase [Flavobacteriia bacterium]|nr:MAG: MBL fold metallo-hydrolase [Flavobacteriia bacterium]
MFIEQLYTDCLAEAAYFVTSRGEAVVIDPIRDIESYLDRLKKHDARLKYIFLTHFHADFMGGHQDLARATGATIVVGPTELKTGYKTHVAHDGELFTLGAVSLELLHTPGHTTESSTLLLRDQDHEPYCIFTGDTLFIGDVGRPDLAQKVVEDLTQEKLARMLYHSLRHKIMTLPDEVIIYPNHGAGSPCGKNMSDETYDTLGHQKMVNYGLRADQTEDEFVTELLDGLTEPPAYFPAMVLGNINGVSSLDQVRANSYKPLEVNDFEQLLKENPDITILDTRPPSAFVKGFIPGAINIELDSSYAIWAGTLLKDIKTKLLLIAPEGRTQEAADRLARVGFDQVLGYLKDGVEAWEQAHKPIDKIPFIDVMDLPELAKKETVNLLDVRRQSEYDSEHIINSINAPLDYWWKSMANFDKDTPYFVYCMGGTRSSMFCSLLKREGYHNLTNVINGGFGDLKQSSVFEISDFLCPTTFL